MVAAEIVTSRNEARRAVEQGGVTLDGEKVADIKATITKEQLEAGVVIKKGKKMFKKVTL